MSTSSRSPSPSSPPPRASRPFFPPAVVIRSDTARHVQVVDPEQPAQSSLYPPLAKEVEWREWAINPAKHGPEKLTRAPVFVQSKGNYDELGRSVADGVQIDVEEGSTKDKRDIEGGESVAQWYSALSRSTSGTNTPSTAPADAAPIQGPIEVVKVSKEDAIDLTAGSDEEENEQKDVKPTTSLDSSKTDQQNATAPLRIRRNEWFIRRALLKSHQTQQTGNASPARPTSIASMLGVTPIQPVALTPQYVLGPENKGYEILKDRLGWGGGGLGRPAGWADEAGPSRHAPTDRKSRKTTPASDLATLKNELQQEVLASKATGETKEEPVDLTGDTASEAGSDIDDDVPPEALSGPGRTAPIATSLKLDKLGLGHSRAQKDRQGNSLKRVTHSHKEIVDAQRRAKYRRPVEGAEPGKAEKIKWKLRDKKETEERRRLAAALNA